MQILTLLRMAPWLAILALLAALAYQSDKARDCAAGRDADRKAYVAAQDAAKAKNLEHVREVEQQQKAKTDAIQSRWDADRARLAELMRAKAAQGRPGPSGSPAVPPAAGGPDGAGQVCIPEGDALSAAENELKLFYLQEWIREQLGIAR